MDYSFSAFHFSLALLLPWIVGAIAARPMIPKKAPGRIPILLGWGYIFGTLMATSLIRLTDFVGVPITFSVLSILLSTVGLVLLMIRRPTLPALTHYRTQFFACSLSSTLTVALLLMLTAWRLYTMLGILTEQPLFGWDSMMNWAPKAIVWFHNGELTDFVNPEQWLQQATTEGSYTLGNSAASSYPEMVPLIFLWHMLGAGTWDHPLLQLPWILVFFNLGLVFFGFLRLTGLSIMAATIGTYCLLSLPYLDIHAVIGGYADIWLAAAFTTGALSLYLWERRGIKGLLSISIFSALICMQLKNPGILLGAVLFAGLLRIKLGLNRRVEFYVIATLTIITFVGFFLEVGLTLPGVGLIKLSINSFQIGLFGPHTFEYHPEVTRPLLLSLFTMMNWNLLWPFCSLVMIVLVAKRNFLSRQNTLGMILLTVALAYVFIFSFTNYYSTAVSLVTLNRAILHLVPVLLFWILLQIFKIEDPRHEFRTQPT